MSSPDRYTIGRLLREVGTQVPAVLPRLHHVPWGFVRTDRLEGKTRILVQLRMAKMMGCPVCVGLLPVLARRAGFGETAIESALAGEGEGLSPEQHGAVAWVSEVLAKNGSPEHVPPAAKALSDPVRDHIALMARVELVVHATGLMFLPHSWIVRAAR